MNRPDFKVLESLSALEHQEPFRVVLDWLQRSLDEQRRMNDSIVEDLQLRQSQGKCQVLDAILSTAREASDIVKKNSRS